MNEIQQEEILKVKNGTFSFKNKKILDDISLSIKKWEFIGITGKNGSGKSTLTKILSGLEFLDEGCFLYKDKEINSKNISSIRHILSMVFQNPNNQIVGSKVIDDLAFGLENMGVPISEMITKIYEISRKLKIKNLLQRNPNYLSGGQKQKVAIAGLLVLNPEIIILDEITSMLDIESKEIIFNLILELKKEHTIIMVSHDSTELMKTDRIILLDKGKVKIDTSPKKLFHNLALLKKYKLEQPFEYLLERN